jgi:hypothetical protein
MLRTSPHRLASTAVVVLLLAGCGGGGKSDEPPPEIEEQLGFSQSGLGYMERQTRVEGRIRDCMRAQGFAYTPLDPFAQPLAVTGKARLSDQEYAKQFGYGISTLLGRVKSQSDPNERIRNSLSAADRAAYDRALWGQNPGATFAEAIDSGDFTELGGCTKRAGEAAFGGTEVLTALVARLDELDQRIVEDQRMVRATERWANCMADEGYRYGDSDEIDEDLARRFAAIVGAGTKPGSTAPLDPTASYDHAALAALQREEVKIAVADLACEQRHITPVERVVRPQYEQSFRRENRSLIVRVRPVG